MFCRFGQKLDFIYLLYLFVCVCLVFKIKKDKVKKNEIKVSGYKNLVKHSKDEMMA
jgi:hypothetical protein